MAAESLDSGGGSDRGDRIGQSADRTRDLVAATGPIAKDADVVPTSATPRRNPVPALLASLTQNTLDPGYAAAARRRAAGPELGRGHRGALRAVAYLAAGVLLVGLVLGAAAGATEQGALSADRVRSGLVDDVKQAQQRVAALEATASGLAQQIRSTQAALGGTGPLQSLASLEDAGGLTPVRGPGLSVVIDGSSAGTGSEVILDGDVQLLVNGLWAAGAEAVSVGGVRLRTTSAIRQAGGAILVDNKPVFWPIEIDAIGNPSTMHVAFVGTAGFGRFNAFASLYEIRFDIMASPELSLAAAAAPDLRYASPLVTTS